MKKILLFSVALILAASFAFAGGGQQGSAGGAAAAPSAALTGPGDWNYKYPQTVVATIGRGGNQTNYFDGENYENNIFTKWMKDVWNIEIKTGFWTEDADHYQRVTLAIASGDLPDLMQLNSLGRQQLIELMESGMVEDLTGLYDKWASPLYKATIESQGGLQTAMSTGFYNGRQYANASTNPNGQDSLVWVREDWRLKLGLPVPKTLDDVVAMADAFVKNDMAGNGQTVGIEIQSPIAGLYNSPLYAEPLLHEVGAYPKIWIDGADGKIAYGSVTPEAKEGLRVLRDLYARGILPKDYVTKDHRASLAAGHMGVLFGPWWINSSWTNLTVNNNPEAIWSLYNWRSAKTGKRHTYEPMVNNGWVVVRKGYAHPELATRFMNLTAEVRAYWDGDLLTKEEEQKFQVVIPANVREAYRGRQFNNWTSWPLSLQVDFKDYLPRLAQSDLRNYAAFKAGNRASLSSAAQLSVEKHIAWEDGVRGQWEPQFYYWRDLGKQYALQDIDTVDIKKTYYPYSTPTMQTRWANLLDLEHLAYNNIIMGVQPLDYFDTFVKEWYAQGGTRIVEEVNQQYGK